MNGQLLMVCEHYHPIFKKTVELSNTIVILVRLSTMYDIYIINGIFSLILSDTVYNLYHSIYQQTSLYITIFCDILQFMIT